MLRIAGNLVAAAIEWISYNIQDAGFTWRRTKSFVVYWTAVTLFLGLISGVILTLEHGFAEVWLGWTFYLVMGGIWLIAPIIFLPFYILVVVPMQRWPWSSYHQGSQGRWK